MLKTKLIKIRNHFEANFVSPNVISATLSTRSSLGWPLHDLIKELIASWNSTFRFTENSSATHLIALLHHHIYHWVHHNTGPVDNVGKHVQVWLRIAGIKL